MKTGLQIAIVFQDFQTCSNAVNINKLSFQIKCYLTSDNVNKYILINLQLQIIIGRALRILPVEITGKDNNFFLCPDGIQQWVKVPKLSNFVSTKFKFHRYFASPQTGAAMLAYSSCLATKMQQGTMFLVIHCQNNFCKNLNETELISF